MKSTHGPLHPGGDGYMYDENGALVESGSQKAGVGTYIIVVILSAPFCLVSVGLFYLWIKILQG